MDVTCLTAERMDGGGKEPAKLTQGQRELPARPGWPESVGFTSRCGAKCTEVVT